VRASESASSGVGRSSTETSSRCLSVTRYGTRAPRAAPRCVVCFQRFMCPCVRCSRFVHSFASSVTRVQIARSYAPILPCTHVPTPPVRQLVQAFSKTLLLPPLSVPSGVVSRFKLRVCYTGNPLDSLCGAAQRAFQAVSSPLVSARSALRTHAPSASWGRKRRAGDSPD
jgi:hypothetical protein